MFIFKYFLILTFGILILTTVSANSVSANSYHSNGATCRSTQYYSPSEVIALGRAYNKYSHEAAGVAILSTFVPKIGSYMGSFLEWFAYRYGKDGNILINMGNQGYSLQMYHCVQDKVYHPNNVSHIEWKFVR